MLFCFAESTWWSWTSGSTLVFWWWPGNARDIVKFGGPVWIHSSLPSNTRTTKPPAKRSKKFELYLEKIQDIVQKQYVQSAKHVRSYMDV